MLNMLKRLQISLAVLLLGLVMALSACAPEPPAGNDHEDTPDATLSVHFLDVGQADAALLLCGGASMLIDGGNVADSSLIVSYLNQQGVTHLNYVVATHAHEDHVGGLAGALNACSVGTVYSPVSEYDSKAFRDFAKYVDRQGKPLTLPTPGTRFSLGSATVEVLGPLQEYDDTNDSSIVLKVSHGENSFLFTGDAERAAEQDLIDAGYDLNATVLKVGHHGSDSSTSYLFLRSILPDYAIISVGEGNSYGHPTDAVLSRLRDAQVTLYRTDLQSHIIAVSDQRSLTFTTAKESPITTNPTQTNGSGQEGNQPVADYYIGNQRSFKIHLPNCTSLPAEHNRVHFATLDEALTEGYSRCGNCMPKNR